MGELIRIPRMIPILDDDTYIYLTHCYSGYIQESKISYMYRCIYTYTMTNQVVLFAKRDGRKPVKFWTAACSGLWTNCEPGVTWS